MSPPRPVRPPVAIDATLARLTDMLDEVGGAVDRDHRRAAARLSELVRTPDDDLGRFAERHLARRDVDAEALKDARELAVELSGLIATLGEVPAAPAVLRELRQVLARRLATGDEGGAPVVEAPATPSSAPPPPMGSPPMGGPSTAPSLPTFMQPTLASRPATFAAPSTVVPPAPVTPPSSPPTDVPPPPRVTALPFASPAAPAPGAGGPATKPDAPATGLPFTRDPQRRG